MTSRLLQTLSHPLYGLIILGASVMAGCSTKAPPAPDFGELYSVPAMQHGPDRNPVIVIPGILGSRLVDENSGNVAWGVVGKGSSDPRTVDGIRQMALPMQPGVPLRNLHDEVRPDGALESLDVKLFGVARLKPEAYASILKALGAGGYQDQTLGEAGTIDYGGDDHYTCFQFGYDWRRSLPENSRLLGDFIEEKRREVSAEHARRFGPAAGRAPVKFDIVAHSMGGLLTRYYLRYGKAPLPDSDRVPTPTWAGARHVEKVILVATPNAGSIYALSQLHDGLKYPLVHEYPTAMLGTLPAIYQLLPRGRHQSVIDASGNSADPLDLAFWEQNQLGLLRPEADADLQNLLPEVPDRAGRLAIVRDHLDKCLTEARRFHAALDQPATPPSNVKLSLFVGDGQNTPQQATFDPDKHTFTYTREEAGDGTVVRSSALLDERGSAAENRTVRLNSPIAWHDIDFIPSDHLGVTRHPVFVDNILFTLLEQ